MPELIKDGEDTGDRKLGPNKNKGFQKYKWYIVGGLAVVAALVYYFYRKNQAAQSTQTTNTPGIDPATGLPYSSEYGGFGNQGGGGTTNYYYRYGNQGPNPNPPGQVTVPSVIGDNRATSAAKLAAVGLVYKQANVVHGAAHATNESPTAGTKVNIGSQVTVTMTADTKKKKGDGGGDGGAAVGTGIAGKPPKPFVFKPTPRISSVQKTAAGAGHVASSNKPGVAGSLPKVNLAA